MTTIVYRDGIVAADSRTTAFDYIVNDVTPKLIRLNDGNIAALTGKAGRTVECVRWYNDGCNGKSPVQDDSINFLVFTRNYYRNYVDGGYCEYPISIFNAWGSGFAAAMGALHHGASAIEAVRAACKVDTGSALPIHYMRVDGGPLRWLKK